MAKIITLGEIMLRLSPNGNDRSSSQKCSVSSLVVVRLMWL